MITTAQVAQRLGISPRAVRALAANHSIGTLITPRMLVFTEDDVTTLRGISTGKRGRPKRG